MGWQPNSVGLPLATALATAFVTMLIGGVVSLASIGAVPPPPSPMMMVQLMDAASSISEPAIAAALPTSATAPPTSAAVAAPPELVADLVPEPAFTPVATLEAVTPPLAMPSSIAALPSPIATPVRPRPARRAVRAMAAASVPRAEVTAPPGIDRALASIPAAVPRSAAPVSAPADISSGLKPYGAGLHRQIERNMLADHRVTQLGVSGTAMIEATIAPDGRVVSARLARSSGTRGIDEAALGAVQRGGFPPFGPHMPAGPITMNVPIGVEAE